MYGHIQAVKDSFRLCQDDDLYGLIQISGNDAEEFLQGQLTQDVAALGTESSLPAAWCNAKGRVITLLRLLALPDSIGLALPISLVDAVVQRLTLYRLRSDVGIEAMNEKWAGVAVSEADAFERLDAAGLLPDASAVCAGHGLIAVDYSAADRFVEIFGTSAAFGKAGLKFDSVLSDEEHTAMKIRAGVAEITPANTEKYTPHMLNLDRIGAISFDKGCYTGQEVVARAQHRGEVKRRLRRYRCAGNPPMPGDDVVHEGAKIGTVVAAGRHEVLATTRGEFSPANAGGCQLVLSAAESSY